MNSRLSLLVLGCSLSAWSCSSGSSANMLGSMGVNAGGNTTTGGTATSAGSTAAGSTNGGTTDSGTTAASTTSGGATTASTTSAETTGSTTVGATTGTTATGTGVATTGTSAASSSTGLNEAGTPAKDGGVDGDASIGTASPKFCDLPGSVRYTTSGVVTVAGGTGVDNIGFLHVPAGFCVHYFGNVGYARQIRFAPGGELFVASPTTGTTSNGGGNGLAAIFVLPDDNGDGVADANLKFDAMRDGAAIIGSLPSTQALLFANDHFYYQNGTKIMRVPYTRGDRAPSDLSEVVADITIHFDSGHWPKALDQADDGTIYVSNGGGQGDMCMPGHPFMGGILKLDGTPGGTPVAKGFRNPIALRCQKGHNLCFASELAMDYSGSRGGREKVVPIRQGDDWGFPCCLSKDLPDSTFGTTDCASIAQDSVSFFIGSTPFGLDFDQGKWPSPYTSSMFVALHGVVGSFSGARVVSVGVDPVTGMPRPGDDLNGQMSSGAMSDFATGWDDATTAHGRPTAMTFAPDGRMFLADDQKGLIVWIAPLGLSIPK